MDSGVAGSDGGHCQRAALLSGIIIARSSTVKFCTVGFGVPDAALAGERGAGWGLSNSGALHAVVLSCRCDSCA